MPLEKCEKSRFTGGGARWSCNTRKHHQRTRFAEQNKKFGRPRHQQNTHLQGRERGMSNANKPPSREAYFFTCASEKGTGPGERPKGAPWDRGPRRRRRIGHVYDTDTREEKALLRIMADERASAFKSPAGPTHR